jgi:glycosyltransferase involved in cell wall biosynthesis
VASNVGGIYTIVKDRRTGILVPPKDPESLARGILDLIEDPELSRSITVNARKLINKKFTLREMADKMESVYEEVIR